MSTPTTIVTSHQALAEVIRKVNGANVLCVDPDFIRLKAPGYNKVTFAPEYEVANPKVEKTIGNLRGTIICAVPPGLAGGPLLYHIAHCLKSKGTTLLYAPMHNLQPDLVKYEIANATPPDPWLVTSMIARRITERMIGIRVMRAFSDHKLAANSFGTASWQSLFYLHLVAHTLKSLWVRKLHFGTCVASEIDTYGGLIYHVGQPNAVGGDFSVKTREIEADYEDPRIPLNLMLQNAGDPVQEVRENLITAYFNGQCSWPFIYGGVSYNEKPLTTFEQSGLLGQVHVSKPALRVIRLYERGRTHFKSISYCSPDRTLWYENAIPAKGHIVNTVEQLHGAEENLPILLKRLTGWQLNLDLGALSKAIFSEYITQTGQKLVVTSKGEKVIEILNELGLDLQVLYLVQRVLENIQVDEMPYEAVMKQVTETLA